MNNFFNKIKKPLFILIMGAVIIGFYFYLSNRKVDNTEKIHKNTPVTQITERDLELNYPGTPRSVVTFYSDVLKVIYSETLSEKEIRTIASKLQGIFDDELLAYNPFEMYVDSLKDEIKEYKTANRIVADYLVEENSYIDFFTYQKQDYAKVDVTYFQHEGKSVIKTYEKFTLRKDKNGRWKILYWEVGKASDMEK